MAVRLSLPILLGTGGPAAVILGVQPCAVLSTRSGRSLEKPLPFRP